MPASKSNKKKTGPGPGPEPERVVIEGDWQEAVRKAVRKPAPAPKATRAKGR